MFEVGQTVRLKADYYYDEIMVNEGKEGTITEIEGNVAVVDFDIWWLIVIPFGDLEPVE